MMHAIRTDKESTFREHRFLLLFIFLLTTLVLYPYAESNRFGYFAFRIFASAAILLSVYAANLRHRLLFFLLALAVPALLQRIFLPAGHASFFSIMNIALSFVFDIFVAIVIFRHVFSGAEAHTEAIFGALCVYLMIGFGFASVYGMVATLQANAFYLDPRTNLHTIPERFDFIYYSFGTMTSLGAAGITAVSAEARAVTILEAILGVLYLAVLIARLISTYRERGTR